MSAFCVVVLAASFLPAARADDPVRFDRPSFSLGNIERAGLDGRPMALPSSPDRLSTLRSRPTSEPGFVKSYLLPRLSSRFDGLAPRHPVMDSPHERVDHLLYENLTHAAQRSAERGARDALKNFLIDTTAIGKLFSSKREGRPVVAEEKVAPPQPIRSNSDFGVGISGGVPEVEWRYRSEGHSLRLRIDTDGAAGLSFSRCRSNETHLSIGYDPRGDRYDLFISLGF